MSIFNEKLLKACYEREIPDLELFDLMGPLEDMDGEERIDYQNTIADLIEKKYPLRKDMPISQQSRNQ